MDGKKSVSLPRTIDAVSGALTQEKREIFLRVLGQVQGLERNEVLSTWWMEAMFDAEPDRPQRLAAVVAGRDLVRLPDTFEEERP